MKLNKKIISAISCIMLVASLTGCGQSPDELKNESNSEKNVETSAENTQYPLVMDNYSFDLSKLETVYEKAPERVVSTGTTSTQILLELGLQDKIVAAIETADKPEECEIDMKEEYLETFKSLNTLVFSEIKNKEVALSYQPDLIIGWHNDFNPYLLDDMTIWKEKGINTYIQRNTGAVEVENLDYIYDDYLEIGSIFNVKDKAQKIVDGLKSRVEEVEKKAKEAKESPDTLVVELTSKGTYRLYGDKTIPHDMLTRLGANDVAQGIESDYTNEHLIEANPDVIIIPVRRSQSPEECKKAIVENEALQNLEAVKNDRVYTINRTEIYGGCSRTIDGFENFAKFIYPEIFNK